MGEAKRRGPRELRVELAVESKNNLLAARQELDRRLQAATKTDVKSAASIALVTALGMNHGFKPSGT